MGPSRYRGEAVCSSLGDGVTAKVEGHVGASRWRGGAMCSLLGGGATVEVKGRADGTPRDSVARHIVQN